MVDIKFSSFFDRQHVIDKVGAAKVRVLARFGALVRLTAKRSIRPRKASAKPGSPPSSHTGRLRDLIFFGAEGTDNAVVGPILFKQSNPTVPQLLEFGGTTTIKKGIPVVFQKFPYMAPALVTQAPKFPELFSGSVEGD